MWSQHKQLWTAVLSLLFIGVGMQSGAAQELISNGNFESQNTGWTLWVPDESQGKNCRFDVVSKSPHDGLSCASLASDDFARFSIGTASIAVQPGEKYRVTAWLRADPAAQIRPETHGMAPPGGFVIRLHMSKDKQDAPGGHFFIEPNGIVARGTPPVPTAPLPKDWTKVEVVIEIPPGVSSMGPSLFSWWISGTIFVDDFSIQKVDASTPVSPLFGSAPAPAPTPTPNP